MTQQIVGLAVLIFVGLAIALYWRLSLKGHERQLEQLQVRIHVNGIRGKSSVTRLVAGVLREGGYVTVAKTTGSAARVIGPSGEEIPVLRRGAATINEQIDVVQRHVTRDVEALVVECMAIRPLYQQYSQDYIVRSDITVITNVREDHQEEMGETLEEIADSLSETIPYGGTLITSEDRPELRERLRRNAERRNSEFLFADPEWITDQDLGGFDYIQFKSNLAIGLAVAQLLTIDRKTAMRGMRKAVPDVGVVRLFHYEFHGKRILWVPLFAANDRESVIMAFEMLQAHYDSDATVIGVLNNRGDRGRRAVLFARMVPLDLSSYLDYVITFGAYEKQVTRQMVDLGYPADRITNLGESISPTLEQILETIAGLVSGREGVLIGMVNIHTHQAEMLMEYFANQRGASPHDEVDLSLARWRAPLGRQRRSRAASRLSRDLSGMAAETDDA